MKSRGEDRVAHKSEPVGGPALISPVGGHPDPLRRPCSPVLAVMAGVYWVVQFAAAKCGSLLARPFFGPEGNLAATMPTPGQDWQAAAFEAIILRAGANDPEHGRSCLPIMAER